MTVGELIEELKKHDPTLLVVVRGYEGGVNVINSLERYRVKLDANLGTWYYGRHEQIWEGQEIDVDDETAFVIELVGDPNSDHFCGPR